MKTLLRRLVSHALPSAPRYMYMLILLTVPAWVARMWTAFSELDYPFSFTLPLIHGALSDMAVCSVLALLLAVLPRVLSAVLLLVWCFLLAGNREFIVVNDANMLLNFMASGEQTTFLRSSVFISSIFFAFFVLLVTLGPAFWAARRLRVLHSKGWAFAFSLVAILGTLIFPLGRQVLAWPQQNFAEENVRVLLYEAFSKEARVNRVMLTQAKQVFFRHDLSGNKLASAPERKPNILIVAVESLSDWHIEKGMMPFLARWREQSMYYPNFISQNRRTHTGMHALLCGVYPNLAAGKSKAEYFTGKGYGPSQPCLATHLRNAGYTPIFMQAANLSYMKKDVMAERMGFLKSLGNKQYENADRYKGSWGIDDMSLMRNTLEQIKDLNDKQPWFVTVLTAGTHHPFNIPRIAEPEADRGYSRAYRTADAALETLVDGLREQGLLENTLLIITADESNARFPKDNIPADLMAGNHGIMIVHTPDQVRLRNENYFAQSDLLLSVLDYLDLPSQSYPGRSLFRHYSTPRVLPFANVYLDRFYTFDTTGTLTMCMQHSMECSQYKMEGTDLYHANFKRVSMEKARLDQIHALVRLNDITRARSDRKPQAVKEEKIRQPKKKEVKEAPSVAFGVPEDKAEKKTDKKAAKKSRKKAEKKDEKKK